jgi:hypothetical protein
MSNTDLVQIWNDTFTLVYRPNVERMGYEDAWKYAKKAADLHVKTLNNAHLHIQNLQAAEVAPTSKVKVQFKQFFAARECHFHFDKQCLYALVKHLKDNVQGITCCGICPDGYKLVVYYADIFPIAFLNNLKTAIEMFFRKYRMEVEYFEES